MELNVDGIEPQIPMMTNTTATPDSDTAGGSSQGEENDRGGKTEEVSFFVGLQEGQAIMQFKS